MRGRAYVWYRLRVNLVHVPEALRPPQEPLDPDYDPFANVTPEERTTWEAVMAERRTTRRRSTS